MELDNGSADGGVSWQQLLQSPSSQSMEKYYAELLATGIGLGLQVRRIGDEMGKGVFADRNFQFEELVLREGKLVGAQHSRNKRDARVCSNCFQYVGSIELQLAWRLLNENGSVSKEDNENNDDMDDDGEEDIPMNEDEERDGAGAQHIHEDDIDCGCKGPSKEKRPLPLEAMAALSSGTLRLPYSDQFTLPPVVKCKGGCSDDVYCSNMCAEAAWQAHHSLLCCGPSSLCKNTAALARFKEFTDETNDIFHIAAQVIAATILRAQNLESSIKGKNVSTLLAAWEPFAMGFKRLWWDTVALPADVDPVDEGGFRDQMKEIAVQSLSLLKDAIYEESYAPWEQAFQELHVHVPQLREIVVASPVEDYFLYIDDLPPTMKAEAEAFTKPFLDALGDDYAAYCQGSGFYALQSCMNHSCRPNAKAFKRDEDRDGHAVLLATRPIKKGEEVTISYIDEDASLEERQAALADYAFVCRCARCLDEDN